MSSTRIMHPPSAHTNPMGRNISSASAEGLDSNVISTQPSTVNAMSSSSKEGGPNMQKAARLRGGCIPCPDGGCCYIIPIPCCL